MSDHLSTSQRHRLEIEQQLQQLHALNHQQSRLIWQLVNMHPEGVVTISEGTADPLWDLNYSRPDPTGNPSLLTVTAARMPEPTDEQIEKLAARLKGQARHPGDDMLAVGLGEYPFHYITQKLAPLIVLHEGTWLAREDYDKLNPSAP